MDKDGPIKRETDRDRLQRAIKKKRGQRKRDNDEGRVPDKKTQRRTKTNRHKRKKTRSDKDKQGREQMDKANKDNRNKQEIKESKWRHARTNKLTISQLVNLYDRQTSRTTTYKKINRHIGTLKDR